ncbi:MAG: DUF1778 domain-containing protein [Thermomicrobiales bacterium]
MSHSLAETPMSRLEARIPTQIYELMQRAARLQGLSLTAYIIATVGEDARRTVDEANVIQLSREDQIRFAETFINPPEPNERLRQAAKRYAEVVTRR